MIVTTTSVRCDGCQKNIPVLQEDSHGRRETAVSIVREMGWRREWVKGKGLKDFCPECLRHSKGG